MLVIIGCGNLNRNDDGVGIVVAQRLQAYLREHPQADVRVYDAGTGGMEVMFQARDASRLIIIDAAVTGSDPGTIYKVPGSEVINRTPPGYSLHNFRWDHALYAGQQIFGSSFPKEVTVYLVEAADTLFGLELTVPVKQAAEKVFGHVMGEVRQHASLHESTREEGKPTYHTAMPEACIHIRNGSLYLNASLYEQYFRQLHSVILMKKDHALLLLPVVNSGAGGLLVKIRNVQGDRVIHAQEFCRIHGIDEQFDQSVSVSWDERSAGLMVQMPSLAYLDENGSRVIAL
ncbi:MAG: peptidase M52 [Nitrospirales bacterium]|nr:MAG: peptidase M52 [Nitrospirales bacterium]